MHCSNNCGKCYTCNNEETDTGLLPLTEWDLEADKHVLQTETPLLVGRVEAILKDDVGKNRYIVKCVSKRIVEASRDLPKNSIKNQSRVAIDPRSFKIVMTLPSSINPVVALMQVQEKPNVTYADIGGCKNEIKKLQEVIEFPLLYPERFVKMGVDPPKGVLLFGPPGTGKTLCARAIANRTNACFILVIGSQLIRKYNGEGSKIVREIFELAKQKKACIIFFDEINAIGCARLDDGEGGNNEVQRIMLELINQLDGFDSRGNIKVIMATNRLDTLDPALVRPGRLDRRIEFGLTDLAGRKQIFKIHSSRMNTARDIRYDLLARLTPNITGAEIRSICTEAGMFAIRDRRKTTTEKDFLNAINKIVHIYKKFRSISTYKSYN